MRKLNKIITTAAMVAAILAGTAPKAAATGCPYTVGPLGRYIAPAIVQGMTATDDGAVEVWCTDALDGDDELKMADELGDVLLQVVLYSCIGAEHRAFTDRDVTSMAAHKMITRHEHVFGKAKAENAQAVVSVWENAKKKERGEQTALERVLDVPLSLPALMRAQKVVRREAGAKGLKLDGAQMFARVAELAGENGGDQAAKEARLGEMLECLCALAEAQGLDAETALRGQTKKRVDRLRGEDEKTL